MGRLSGGQRVRVRPAARLAGPARGPAAAQRAERGGLHRHPELARIVRICRARRRHLARVGFVAATHDSLSSSRTFATRVASSARRGARRAHGGLRKSTIKELERSIQPQRQPLRAEGVERRSLLGIAPVVRTSSSSSDVAGGVGRERRRLHPVVGAVRRHERDAESPNARRQGALAACGAAQCTCSGSSPRRTRSQSRHLDGRGRRRRRPAAEQSRSESPSGTPNAALAADAPASP